MVAKDRPVRTPVGGLEIATAPLVGIGVKEVTLLAVMDADFERHIVSTHALMESMVNGQGGDFDVQLEELIRLFVTALHTRVQHTRQRNGYPVQAPFIHPKHSWTVPTQFAYVVNAVGYIRLENGLEIVPKMSDEALQLVMTREEWHELAVRLRGYEPLGVRLVHALETRELGDEKVMVIQPVIADTGEIIYTSTVSVSGPQFLTASALGIAPRPIPVDVDPLWFPWYTVGARRLVMYYPRFAQTSEAG